MVSHNSHPVKAIGNTLVLKESTKNTGVGQLTQLTQLTNKNLQKSGAPVISKQADARL